MVREEVCSNSSAQLVHCNTAPKCLNVYTETVMPHCMLFSSGLRC